MRPENLMPCDGCGQHASPEHIARRLQRLEWTTRYRPIHIQTLLLGAVSPSSKSDFLYSPELPHTGEAAQLFAAASLVLDGKSADTLHSEFQRRGLFLAHLLECPLELSNASISTNSIGSLSTGTKQSLFACRIPAVLTRIRRSLKPRRIALISPALVSFVDQFLPPQAPCDVLLDNRSPFNLEDTDSLARLRDLLVVPIGR
jgi:hypothetical protein